MRSLRGTAEAITTITGVRATAHTFRHTDQTCLADDARNADWHWNVLDQPLHQKVFPDQLVVYSYAVVWHADGPLSLATPAPSRCAVGSMGRVGAFHRAFLCPLSLQTVWPDDAMLGFQSCGQSGTQASMLALHSTQ